MSSVQRGLSAALVVLLVVAILLSAYNTVQLVQLERQVKSVSSSVGSLNSTIQGVSSRVSSLNSTIQSSIANVNRLSEMASALGSELSELNATLSGRIASLESQLTQLESEVRFPVTIVDALNRTVVIPSMPMRIVTLDPAATEIALAVGAGGQLVAVDNDSVLYLPPPFNDTVHEMVANGSLKVISSTYSSPDIEQIMALSPDLVIGTAGWGYNNYIASTLASYGIPVLLLPSSESLEDVYRAVIMVGEATGHVNNAVKLVESMSAQITAVERSLENVSYVNVTVILWINPTYVAGGGTFINDMMTLAGGVNVFQNLSGWPVISSEDLLQANPSVIILVSNGGLFNASSLYQWLNSTIGPAYVNIAAIKYGRVYVIGGWYESVMSEPAVLTPMAVKLLAIILHPQAFNLTSVPQLITPSTLSPSLLANQG